MSDRPQCNNPIDITTSANEDPSIIINGLCEMGFPSDRVREAVKATGGTNFDDALEMLLKGAVSPFEDEENATATETVEQVSCGNNTSANKDSRHRTIVECAISQYDIAPTSTTDGSSSEEVTTGRSACSCIALVGALKFLKAITTTTTTGPSKQGDDEHSNLLNHKVKEDASTIVNANFLQECILDGFELYVKCIKRRRRRQDYLASSDGDKNNEHFSPEDVLLLDLDHDGTVGKELCIGGIIHQGLLSSSSSSPPHQHNVEKSGLHSQLMACLRDNQQHQVEWTAVVMTKTPETVLILLPPQPNKGKDNCKADLPYILIDSHPRQTQFNVSGSYALLVQTLEEVEHALLEIFPPTELDPSINELMSMMYNSFDLYPLQISKKD